MTEDIRTVLWKEWKSMFRAQGRKTQFLFGLVSPLALAVFFPIQMGSDWATSAFSLAVAFIMPLLMVGMTIPDAFAGERERHTLPTLLASRLSDRAILLGKMGLSIALGWVATVAVLLLSLVTLNVAHWNGAVQFFALRFFAADLVLALLVGLLTAGIGVLFSLRATTVQQAQQNTMGVLLILPMILQFVPFVLLSSSSGRRWLTDTLGRWSFAQVMAVVMSFLLVLIVALFAAVRRRFKRAQLILS